MPAPSTIRVTRQRKALRERGGRIITVALSPEAAQWVDAQIAAGSVRGQTDAIEQAIRIARTTPIQDTKK